MHQGVTLQVKAPLCRDYRRSPPHQPVAPGLGVIALSSCVRRSISQFNRLKPKTWSQAKA